MALFQSNRNPTGGFLLFFLYAKGPFKKDMLVPPIGLVGVIWPLQLHHLGFHHDHFGLLTISGYGG